MPQFPKIKYNHSKIHALSLDKLRSLILSLFNQSKKPSFLKIQNKEHLRTLFLVFHRESQKEKFKDNNKEDLEENKTKNNKEFNLTFYPLQDNLNLHDLHTILLKQPTTPTKPNLSFLNKEYIHYLKYFVIQDAMSVYEERNSIVNSTHFIKNMSSNSNLNDNSSENSYSSILSYKKPYKHSNYHLLAVDCEMVLTKKGKELGRLTVIDHTARVLLDVIVLPSCEIIDYKTEYSGLTKESYNQKENDILSFNDAQSHLLTFLGTNTYLLGHSLTSDLHILKIYHDKLLDTSRLVRTNDNYKIQLKKIVKKYLNRNIQDMTHCSREDAVGCLELFCLRVQGLVGLFEEKKEWGFVKIFKMGHVKQIEKHFYEKQIVTLFTDIKNIALEKQTVDYYILFKEKNGKIFVGLYDNV